MNFFVFHIFNRNPDITEKDPTYVNGSEHSLPKSSILNPRVSDLKYDANSNLSEKGLNIARKEAQEKRKNSERTTSVSSTTSTHTRGIGANGPLGYSTYLSADETTKSDAVRYDKGIGAHATPPITRKPYDTGTSVTTWF